MIDLERVYRETLDECAPDHLVERVATRDLPRNVAAIGKCAGALIDGLAKTIAIEHAIAAIPRGYPAPKTRCDVFFGGHPHIDADTFRAGNALLDFVSRRDDVTFLISGGGSACAEVPLTPFFVDRDLIEVNARLLTSGIPIARMNLVRKHLSAIKGGRLGARVRGRAVSLLFSDVATGDLASVASGPTLPDSSTLAEAIAILERIGGCDHIVTKLRDELVPETVQEIARGEVVLIADNRTLTNAAASAIALQDATPKTIDHQIEDDVDSAARDLARRASKLQRGDVLVAGGEPTVEIRGNGRGGRCLELAVRFAIAYEGPAVSALFASSDGVDGNSGVSGVLIDAPVAADRAAIEARLATSDSLAAAAGIGRPIIIPATGNNLRDLYLVART